VVHSLFKEYHSCARSFSPPPLLALLSLCRPAVRRLKKPLLPKLLPTLLPKPPPTPRPTLLLRLLTLLRPRPTLLLLTLLLRTPKRRCNLRRTAMNWGAKALLSRPFSYLRRAHPEPAARSTLFAAQHSSALALI
jgi:hypothetical protein